MTEERETRELAAEPEEAWVGLTPITSGRMRAVWQVAHREGFRTMKTFWQYAHEIKKWDFYDVLEEASP